MIPIIPILDKKMREYEEQDVKITEDIHQGLLGIRQEVFESSGHPETALAKKMREAGLL